MTSSKIVYDARGCTPYHNVDVDETPASVAAKSTRLLAIHVINVGAAPRYLKLYDALVANVTVGTTVPKLTFAIPAQFDNNGGGFTLSIPEGIYFATGLVIAATTGVADNDTGAPGTKEVVVNLAVM